jgi:hypothetical protein
LRCATTGPAPSSGNRPAAGNCNTCATASVPSAVSCRSSRALGPAASSPAPFHARVLSSPGAAPR